MGSIFSLTNFFGLFVVVFKFFKYFLTNMKINCCFNLANLSIYKGCFYIMHSLIESESSGSVLKQ